MRKLNKSGFTLIELITVIVLLGIIGGFGGLFLVKMIQSYQWAEDNAHIAQKAQVALTRIAVEMVYADSIEINGHTITIKNGDQDLVVQRDNNELTLGNNPLTDLVTGFEVIPNDNYITVRLTMSGANQALQEFEQTMATP